MQALNETLAVVDPVRHIRPVLCEPNVGPLDTPRELTSEVVVRFLDVDADMSFFGRRINAGGLFLESDLLFELDDELYVLFIGPDMRPIEARARVSAVELGESGSTPGMGLAFTQIDDDALSSLAPC